MQNNIKTIGTTSEVEFTDSHIDKIARELQISNKNYLGNFLKNKSTTTPCHDYQLSVGHILYAHFVMKQEPHVIGEMILGKEDKATLTEMGNMAIKDAIGIVKDLAAKTRYI